MTEGTSNALLSSDETKAILDKESITVLDFLCGPIAAVSKMPYMPTWSSRGASQNAAEHGYVVTLTALAIHQLCRERNILPYSTIDGTVVALQAMTSSVLSINNLVSITIDNNPLLADFRRDISPVVIRTVTRPLAPCIERAFTTAWVNQTTNAQNPISQLVTMSEIIVDILDLLNQLNNVINNAERSIQAKLIELMTLGDAMDNGLKDVAESIAVSVAELFNYNARELMDANNT